jgi:hypothetical protein
MTLVLHHPYREGKLSMKIRQAASTFRLNGLRSRWRKLSITVTAAGTLAALPVSVAAAAPTAFTPIVTRTATQVLPRYNYGPWTVVNSPGTYDSSPNRQHSNGVALANGTQVTLECYYFGGAAGPYGNTLWYEVGFDNWVNDHYLNTPGTAVHPQPQTPRCYRAGTTARHTAP